jgi:hypothetical protein
LALQAERAGLGACVGIGAMTPCLWCGRRFMPRASGGKPQSFCRPACRRALDARGRRWIAAALADGRLTIGDLRNGRAATRALATDGKLPPGCI